MTPVTYTIYSFYNKNVNARVPEYQSAVFKKWGHKVTYVINDTFSHGDFLNYVCQLQTGDEVLIVFDVDCIPVNKNWLNEVLNDLRTPHTIVGAAQTANHLREGKNLYIAPFFFAISTVYIKELGYPDMRMVGDMDAGQNLTEEIRHRGGNIKFWWPTHVEEEKWNLYHSVHSKFGPGTTYNNAVYHAFFSRFDQSDRFVKKCKSILSFSDRFRFIKIPRMIKKLKKFF
jgi:hypothetical protein